MVDEKNIENRKNPTASNRFVFVDQARAFALFMMIVGHSLDRFLGEPWRSGEVYREYQFYRGVTSALFLMVSGFSVVIASYKYWDDYVRLTPRLLARLRRIGYVLFFGYWLHLYGHTLVRMVSWYTPSKMEAFLRFNVLQNIGYSLLLVHIVAFIVRKREYFWVAMLALFVFFIGISQITYDRSVEAMFPTWFAPVVNSFHRSTFPMVPFTCFMLIGAVFAHWFWVLRPKGQDWKAMVALIVTGVGFIVFEQLLWRIVTRNQFLLPGNTFARCGCAMIVIGVMYFIEKKVRILPRLALLMSTDSLAIYVIHIPLVYSGTLKILADYRRLLSPSQVFLYVGVQIAFLLLVAAGIQWMRNRYPVFVTRFRRTLLLSFFILFFGFAAPNVSSMLLAVLIGATALYGIRTFRWGWPRGRQILRNRFPNRFQ